jgi:hypothetical protein
MVRRMVLALTVAGLLVGLLAPPASASVRIVQPTEKYAGKTYGQWSAAWWKWAADISEPNSPVDDPTGANCAVKQRGAVWFLAGNTGGTTSRTCTVPADKGILFPIINAECSTGEGNGTTEQELRDCAAGLMNQVTATSASVDGATVDLGPPSGGRFRFASPLFSITFAPNNAFGVAAGTSPSVADGFWVLVKPLAVGKHTIDFQGVFAGGIFQVTVHYDLTVTEQ